jgi:uncharacterized protein YggE
MRLFICSVAMLAGLWSLSAQQPQTVTVTVSANQPANAGTATFRIQFLDANLASTIDSALNVLKDTGVSANNLDTVSVSLSQGFVVTQYDFTLRVPAAEFSPLRDRLITIQRGVPTSQAVGWTTSYAASDDDVSAALEAALPGLLTKARQRAGVVASAVGMSVGSVQSISTPSVSNSGLNLAMSLTVTYAVQ